MRRTCRRRSRPLRPHSSPRLRVRSRLRSGDPFRGHQRRRHRLPRAVRRPPRRLPARRLRRHLAACTSPVAAISDTDEISEAATSDYARVPDSHLAPCFCTVWRVPVGTTLSLEGRKNLPAPAQASMLVWAHFVTHPLCQTTHRRMREH